jgi:muconolactone delta-isomerase
MSESSVLVPYRMDGESFEDYKFRQKEVNKYYKSLTEWKLVWDSKEQGTYRKEK